MLPKANSLFKGNSSIEEYFSIEELFLKVIKVDTLRE